VNQDGFYDELLAFFAKMVRERFKSGGMLKLMRVANTVDEVWPLLDEAEDAGAVDALWR
jgi:predicted Rossmann-fold nucleotide-binding protein